MVRILYKYFVFVGECVSKVILLNFAVCACNSDLRLNIKGA